MSLALVALGVAACDADHKVREQGGNNRGPRIRQYLANVGFAEGAPWCAAAVQYWWDVAARTTGETNPLDAVIHEALVQSYFEQFEGHMVERDAVRPGCLVLFKFGSSERDYDHIGLVSQPPRPGSKGFHTIEGNTSDENQRDGDAVAFKVRELDAGYPVLFLDIDREGWE